MIKIQEVQNFHCRKSPFQLCPLDTPTPGAIAVVSSYAAFQKESMSDQQTSAVQDQIVNVFGFAGPESSFA